MNNEIQFKTSCCAKSKFKDLKVWKDSFFENLYVGKLHKFKKQFNKLISLNQIYTVY